MEVCSRISKIYVQAGDNNKMDKQSIISKTCYHWASYLDWSYYNILKISLHCVHVQWLKYFLMHHLPVLVLLYGYTVLSEFGYAHFAFFLIEYKSIWMSRCYRRVYFILSHVIAFGSLLFITLYVYNILVK